ncbi:hypothetical protein QJS04_geneDACA019748 [Acorus gramineus]|uniref:Uncharacterized protein n=1 Tax=Acorus gramineus TaxID=55184 RepID=A0AAV9BTM4_ACOGR|nr:hypothetical protein QJS04_geneDACA019748 [Acorus gramineus]
MPETGLKKLRNFTFRPGPSSSGKGAPPSPSVTRSGGPRLSIDVPDGGIGRSNGEDLMTPTTPATPTPTTNPAVTRSIMIIRPPSPAGTPPASPAGSTPPLSPFFGGRDGNRFRRKSSSVYERGTTVTANRSSGPPHDV